MRCDCDGVATGAPIQVGGVQMDGMDGWMDAGSALLKASLVGFSCSSSWQLTDWGGRRQAKGNETREISVNLVVLMRYIVADTNCPERQAMPNEMADWLMRYRIRAGSGFASLCCVLCWDVGCERQRTKGFGRKAEADAALVVGVVALSARR